MIDDATGGRPGGPATHSSPDRSDPTPDRFPGPGQRPVPTSAEPAIRRSRTGVLWAGMILSALVLLLLLVFILQNSNPVQISFFALDGVLPLGVALLLAAIAGVLLVAIPGSLRIMQLRRAARRGAPGKV